MKPLLLSLLAIFLLLPTYASAGVQDEPFYDDLVSYWKLDEVSGVRYDIHGSNDLTDNNTVLYDTGKINNSALFARSNSEYLSITDASQTSLDSCPSAQFWFYTWASATSFTDGNWHGLVAKQNTAGTSSFNTGILRDGSTYYILFGVNHSGGEFGSIEVIPTPSTGVPYLYLFQYNGTTGEKHIYINNTLEDTETSGPNNYNNSAASFTLGHRNQATSDHWNGWLDETAFGCGVLTSDDRSAIYNSGNALQYDSEAPDPAPDVPSYSSFNNYLIASSSCILVGTTTECLYYYATTGPIQTTSDDLIFGLSIIMFFLATIWFALIFTSISKQSRKN